MKNSNEIKNWPTTQTFILQDIFDLNPHIKEITARVNFNKVKETGKFIELGANTGGKGRPQKVFAYTPITSIVIQKAKSEKINLADGLESRYALLEG